MGRVRKSTNKAPLTGPERRDIAIASSNAGVKGSSSNLYERKWKHFKCFCSDEKLQEGLGTLNPESDDQPTESVIGKIVEFFHYKVVEEGCDPAEVINIRSALNSIYKRRFGRIGEWKVHQDGSTEGNPTNAIMVTEAIQYYKRMKKVKGYKRSLPFRYRYMSRLWESCKAGKNRMFSTYVMGAASLCFSLWLRIDELIKLTWSSVSFNETNDEGVPFHLIFLRDRKYNRSSDGQSYALYKMLDEECACAFTHLSTWISFYRSILGRELRPSDPLFPRMDDIVSKCFFGEFMVQQTFMNTINNAVRDCGIIPRNAFGMDMGRLTAHCFRRGGAQHRFVTGKSRWPLDVVKWWGGWGDGDDVNTILRYLLEETLKYEKNYTHFMFTRGSDIRLFNTCVTTLGDVSREVRSVQDSVNMRLSHIEQATAAHRLLLSEEMKKFASIVSEKLSSMENKMSPQVTGEGVTDEGEYGQNTARASASHSGMYTHIPNVLGWREVIEQWNIGCPSKNLMVPLKDWPRGSRTSSLKYKYHDRKIIASAYLALGEENFIEKYQPDIVTLKQLKRKIRDSVSTDE